jgi:hypothetical protein
MECISYPGGKSRTSPRQRSTQPSTIPFLENDKSNHYNHQKERRKRLSIVFVEIDVMIPQNHDTT